jgi:hypothetical protein
MFFGSNSALSKILTVWLVALSLLFVGFGHRPMLNAASSEQAIYLASMGLTAADLCGKADEDGPQMMGDCPACHIATAMALPQPDDSLKILELRVAAAILVPAQTRVLGRAHNPSAPPRAPPLV